MPTGETADPQSEQWALGVDLGGTKIKAAMVNGAGKVLETAKVATDPRKTPERITKQIVDLVSELSRRTECRPVGLGLGVAGQVRRDTGVIRFGPNLDWYDVPLKEDLHRALEMPVYVLNDVRAATWGEWRYGAGRGLEDLACVFVGTGVGGGIVSGGRLLSGYANTAGELGHMTVSLNGPVCTCGNSGCLESLVGGWAIALRARETVRTHPAESAMLLELAGGDRGRITAELVSQAFLKNDPIAMQVYAGVVQALIAGLASLVNLFGPRRIILGGGVMDGLPVLIPRVAEGVRQRALAAALESFQIVPARLGSDAGVIGAATHLLDLTKRTSP